MPSEAACVPWLTKQLKNLNRISECLDNAQNWIEIDEEYEGDIELRRKLLAEQRDIVLQSTPEVTSFFLSWLHLLHERYLSTTKEKDPSSIYQDPIQAFHCIYLEHISISDPMNASYISQGPEPQCPVCSCLINSQREPSELLPAFNPSRQAFYKVVLLPFVP